MSNFDRDIDGMRRGAGIDAENGSRLWPYLLSGALVAIILGGIFLEKEEIIDHAYNASLAVGVFIVVMIAAKGALSAIRSLRNRNNTNGH